MPAQRAYYNSFADTPGQPHPATTEKTITPEVRGDVYMARKMYREAVEAYKLRRRFTVILNRPPASRTSSFWTSTARHYYQLSVKADPHYAEAINNIGTVYYARKSYRRAVNEYQKALRYEPEAASIVSNLGTAEFARKKYKEAALLYQRALSLDPDVFEHQNTQGVLLQDRSVDEHALYHYYLAKTYAQAGMNDRALQYIRKSLEEGFKDRI